MPPASSADIASLVAMRFALRAAPITIVLVAACFGADEGVSRTARNGPTAGTPVATATIPRTAATLAPDGPAPAGSENVPTAEVTFTKGEGLWVHRGPTFEFTVLEVLAVGELVTVVGRSEDGYWLALEQGGWIAYSDDWLDLSVDVEALDVIRTPAPAATSSPFPQPEVMPETLARVTTANLNVRFGPGLEFTVPEQLQPRDLVTVIGRSADGEWLALKARGWVSYRDDWLDLSVDVDVLAVRSSFDRQVSPLLQADIRTGIIDVVVDHFATRDVDALQAFVSFGDVPCIYRRGGLDAGPYCENGEAERTLVSAFLSSGGCHFQFVRASHFNSSAIPELIPEGFLERGFIQYSVRDARGIYGLAAEYVVEFDPERDHSRIIAISKGRIVGALASC